MAISDPLPAAPDGRGHLFGIGRRHRVRFEEGFYLRSLRLTVRPLDVLMNSDVAALVAEDICWSAMTEDWRRRRPPLHHRADRVAWRSEVTELETERSRLRKAAVRIGVTLPGGVVEAIRPAADDAEPGL